MIEKMLRKLFGWEKKEEIQTQQEKEPIKEKQKEPQIKPTDNVSKIIEEKIKKFNEEQAEKKKAYEQQITELNRLSNKINNIDSQIIDQNTDLIEENKKLRQQINRLTNDLCNVTTALKYFESEQKLKYPEDSSDTNRPILKDSSCRQKYLATVVFEKYDTALRNLVELVTQYPEMYDRQISRTGWCKILGYPCIGSKCYETINLLIKAGILEIKSSLFPTFDHNKHKFVIKQILCRDIYQINKATLHKAVQMYNDDIQPIA